MNEKDKFIQELRKQLAVLGIHNNVVNEIIMDMKQHFELSKLDGKSETDVILSLENPCDLAKEYLWLKDLTEKKKSVVNIYIYQCLERCQKCLEWLCCFFGAMFF